jgi:hypothetical protein
LEFSVSGDDFYFDDVVDLETEFVGKGVVAAALEPTAGEGDSL